MIKCIGFGKSLKQLFIIGLISCFGFGVNSSVKAVLEMSGNSYYGDLGTPFTEGLYTYEISPNLDFTSEIGTSSFNGFYRQSSYWGSSPYEKDVIGWVDGNLYAFLGNVGGSNDNDLNTQGFYDKWCVVPVSVNPGVYNSVYGCEGKFTTSISDILEFNPNFTNFTIEKIGFTSPSVLGGVLQLCFKDTSNYYCVACSPGDCPSGLTGSNNYTISNMDFNTFVSFPFSSSPFSRKGVSFIPRTGSNFAGQIVVDSGYTNHDMVEGFECVGLQPALCYGGFDINNIFQPDESFEDFTGYIAGEGATIFEIYNLYSGSFSNLNQFLNTVLTRYQNGQINSFKTEPKALLMLGAQMNTAGFKTSYIASYCNLLLNKNNDDIYTGNSVDDLRVQSCLRNKKTREGLKNSEGKDILSQTTDTGIFGSGEDVDFDPDTFFSTLMNEITTKLDKTLSGGSVGIIPGYIIAFTLGIIFIRLISH